MVQISMFLFLRRFTQFGNLAGNWVSTRETATIPAADTEFCTNEMDLNNGEIYSCRRRRNLVVTRTRRESRHESGMLTARWMKNGSVQKRQDLHFKGSRCGTIKEDGNMQKRKTHKPPPPS
jgi:ribosomal protein L44E